MMMVVVSAEGSHHGSICPCIIKGRADVSPRYNSVCVITVFIFVIFYWKIRHPFHEAGVCLPSLRIFYQFCNVLLC